ncbi:MAG: PD-(D/E)XK nuclease family protein, partial [Lentisphaerota bacterium]
ELLGWLELAWEDAPVVLLADLNDGIIPDAITADPFLPDSIRREMGLRDNRYRLARDAHTLETIVQSRRQGNVRGFMPRRSPGGDPLKPSRLLLQGESHELAERALYYFADAPSPFPSTTRSPGWIFTPPFPDPENTPRALSISSFKRYLDCPFTFYLDKIVRMDEPYKDRVELDARDFGTICHEVFKAFADSAVKDSAQEEDLQVFLLEQTDREFRQRFGEHLTVAILIQRDVIRQRMAYAAPVQARLRREGWRILHREIDVQLPCDGMLIRGRIDRVDEHEKDGRIRIIDYKTSAQPEQPEAAHLAKLNARSTHPAFAYTADQQLAWRDLQLPLYMKLFRHLHPEHKGPLETAYFVLPNAVSDTELLPWAGMREALVDDAWACAGRIIRRIKAGIFWPSNMTLRKDDPYYRLFFSDIERFLDSRFVAEMKKRVEHYERDESAQGKEG